jgi:hypothetical protein
LSAAEQIIVHLVDRFALETAIATSRRKARHPGGQRSGTAASIAWLQDFLTISAPPRMSRHA